MNIIIERKDKDVVIRTGKNVVTFLKPKKKKIAIGLGKEYKDLADYTKLTDIETVALDMLNPGNVEIYNSQEKMVVNLYISGKCEVNGSEPDALGDYYPITD